MQRKSKNLRNLHLLILILFTTPAYKQVLRLSNGLENSMISNLVTEKELIIFYNFLVFQELKDRIPGFTDDKKSIKGAMNNTSSCVSSALHNGFLSFFYYFLNFFLSVIVPFLLFLWHTKTVFKLRLKANSLLVNCSRGIIH